jgi:uncharacterized protein (TIGR02300 family)
MAGAGAPRRGPAAFSNIGIFGVFSHMAKAEWGTKRTCPKCGTRFYDLGKEDPVTCLNCGIAWDPEPVLKSKQPMPFDAPKKEVEVDEKEDSDLAAEDLVIDEDAEENPDDEVDLGGDDDIGLAAAGDEDEEV